MVDCFSRISGILSLGILLLQCRQKQVYVERCAQLQHALQSLQNASERREQAERKLRMDYENDLPNRSGSSTNSETDNLKWQLREKDAQIMRFV